MMPYKYVIEMICDDLAAGIIYNKNKWTKETQLNYWNKVKDKNRMNEKLKEFLTTIYEDISVKGVDEVLNKKYLKQTYDRVALK